MKCEIAYELSSHIEDMVFPEHLITNKQELILICMEVCRELAASDEVNFRHLGDKGILVKVDRMSRFFFFKKGKYISLAIPDSLAIGKKPEGRMTFSYEDRNIDADTWSKLISLAHEDRQERIDTLSYYIDENRKGIIDIDIATIYMNFEIADFGYLRYDHDESGFRDAKNKGNEHYHPLNHLDIHLASHATFKTGLPHRGFLKPSEFVEIVNNSEPRWYLQKI